MSRLICLLAAVFVISTPALGEEKKNKPAKPLKNVSFLLRGAHCEADLKVLRKSLGAVKGLKWNADDLRVGKRPRYFTAPFVVEMRAGGDDTIDIGRLAAGLAKAKTPHRKTSPPKVNLVLYTKSPITEKSVMRLRAALRDVNGLEVSVAGGLGGIPKEGYFWVQLEAAGGAALKNVLEALKKDGVDASIDKP